MCKFLKATDSITTDHDRLCCPDASDIDADKVNASPHEVLGAHHRQGHGDT